MSSVDPTLGRRDPRSFRKLSAKMVELSLQENQRERTLRGPVPSHLAQTSWPFLWPFGRDQSIVQPPVEDAERSGTKPRRAAVAIATDPNPQQTYETPRELTISNFGVLYTRATFILREMTNYRSGSAVLRNLRDGWKSVRNDRRLSTFREHIRGRLTVAAQRTDLTGIAPRL